MKKRILFWTFIIVVYLVIFLLLNRDYPYSKSDVVKAPEVAIANEMEVEAKEIKILAEASNSKERAIIFEYEGKQKYALALSGILGLRYNLHISNFYNVEDKNGVLFYNPKLPAYFVINDFFKEQRYVYMDNKFTLEKSTSRIHGDIKSIFTSGISVVVVALLVDHFRNYGKKRDNQESS